MPQDVFYWVLNMSIAGAIMGGIILLLRLFERIPRRVMVLLWAIPFLRLWIPVGLGSDFGLMELLSRLGTKTLVIYERVGDPVVTGYNFAAAAESYNPIIYKTNLWEDLFRVSGTIWLIGALALLVACGIVYLTTLRELKDAKALGEKVYVSEKITAPAVYGVVRPRIILPPTDKDMTYVLLHERAHIRRGDNLWRLVAFVTAAVHWFNPLVWVFLKLYLQDMELACDEAVLANCGAEKRKDYALALVEWAESPGVFASAFGGAGLRVRVKNILSYRKMSVVSSVCFGALVAAMCYILLTNAG